jgi:membrane-bound lytic murein transglycosylase B
LSRGIRPEVLDEALGEVQEPLPVVLERDRSQAEVVLPLETYIARRLTPTLIRRGREKVANHRLLLDEVSEKYGVPAAIVAGIWGIESNFGGFTGVRPTISALATLAWDPRRSKFFRGELFDALEILNRGDIELSKMRGSWAGAMGQPQFMPSSYLQYAEDFDGDGRRDIWSSPDDIFASIANYLKGRGWSAGGSWGREVTIPADTLKQISTTVARRTGSCQAIRDMSVPLSLSEWRQLGVMTASGKKLPKTNVSASLVSGMSRHFLVYRNYDVLLDYNCAQAYALTVGLLSDRLQSGTSAGGVQQAASRKRPQTR